MDTSTIQKHNLVHVYQKHSEKNVKVKSNTIKHKLKYIPDMTFQLPRLLHISFSTFYACQSVLFLYLATSFAKKRAVTKHLTSKFCFVQHFLIKIQLTRFMVKCAKIEEAAKSYLECTLLMNFDYRLGGWGPKRSKY